MIFPVHFCSLTDRIFQFKFRRWLSGLLNCTIDSDIHILNHILLMLLSDHDEQKTKHSHTKNKMRKFQNIWKSEFLWLIYDSSNNVYILWCLQKGRTRYYRQNQICWKPWLLNKSLKHENPIPELCIFCLIQGINPRINTYWSCIVQNWYIY